MTTQSLSLSITSSAAVITAIAAAAPTALAGFERFSGSAAIFSDPIQEVGAGGDAYGTYSADLDSSTLGSVVAHLDASESSLSIYSSINTLQDLAGHSGGTAHYTFAAPGSIMVDWNWSNTESFGGWKVSNANDEVVASLTYESGMYSATGGAFANTPVGSGFIELSGGAYKFEAYFTSVVMPASSAVNFQFVIPAPGAIAFAFAGGIARSRRRK